MEIKKRFIMKWLVVAACLLTICDGLKVDESRSVWGYECLESKCVKVEISDNNVDKAVSFPICRIFCGNELGTLWPRINGVIKVGDVVMHIDNNKFNFNTPKFAAQEKYWDLIIERFNKQIKAKIPPKTSVVVGGKTLTVTVTVASESIDFSLDMDESYTLKVKQENNEGHVLIDAKSFYGARHGIETLSQLIVFDDIRNEFQTISDIEISDEPRYKYRGLALDTSRNYFSVESIKRTLDAMGMTKLNTFHWHITDSHSFPLVIKSHPELSRLGAYAKHKVYTAEEISDIVVYGKVRGVRILPEFDAPAHVGEGWQNKNLLACFNYQPWSKYCVEPPCGQFDPSKDELYDILENIYGEMYEMFGKPDIFHMGGDEVSTSCWNSSLEIQKWMQDKGWNLDQDSFMKLWGHFQDNALERFEKISNKKDIPIILWTSKLTEVPYIDKYLNKDKYIIQIWTKGNDPQIGHLLDRGYNLILSNYDALYLDCGFSGWVTDGNNWCSPYIGWQKVYGNSPTIIGGSRHSQMLGSEAALWSEQADEWTLDSRMWPRASAMAERLWSDPAGSWRDAESRMLVHRERLVENGIAAESLQPEWCLQNELQCPL